MEVAEFRLLVIEDDKSHLNIITKRLKEVGYSIDAIANERWRELYILDRL